MAKKKKRIILLLLVMILAAIISSMYIKDNEYRKTAWNALSSTQQKNVIGGQHLSYVKTINPKDSYVLSCHGNEITNYNSNEMILIYFKKGVPERIIKSDIALMDGAILSKRQETDWKDKSTYYGYLVYIRGLSTSKSEKFIERLDNHDPFIKDAQVADFLDSAVMPNQGIDLKNKETKIVTFYYMKDFDIHKYVVFIIEKSNEAYVANVW